MGKVLILPRTDADLQRLAYHSAPERVPDFAARLARWRQQDMERRERFRIDMALIKGRGYVNLLGMSDRGEDDNSGKGA